MAKDTHTHTHTHTHTQGMHRSAWQTKKKHGMGRTTHPNEHEAITVRHAGQELVEHMKVSLARKLCDSPRVLQVQHAQVPPNDGALMKHDGHIPECKPPITNSTHAVTKAASTHTRTHRHTDTQAHTGTHTHTHGSG